MSWTLKIVLVQSQDTTSHTTRAVEMSGANDELGLTLSESVESLLP